MNRSILIVMLDFIVLSLLSMITGLSTLENPYGNDGTVVSSKTAQVISDKLKNEKTLLEEAYLDLKNAQDKFGYSQARSEAMQRLEAQLAATDLQIEILEKKDIAGVDVKENKSLSNDAANLPSKYRHSMSQIAGSSKSGSGSSDGNILDAFNFGEPGELNFNALKETRRILGVTTISEDEAQKASVDSEEIRQLQDALRGKDMELAAISKNLRLRENEIVELKDTAKLLNETIRKKEGEIIVLTEAGHRKDRAILAANQELKVSRQKLNRKTREVGVRVKEVKSVQKVLNHAVKDLSKTRAVAAKAQQEARDAKNKLVTVREDLAQLRKRIEGNVLDYYDQTVQNIRVYLEQERFFANRRDVQNLYLPVIRVENKPMVISLFRLLCGSRYGEEMEFDDVINFIGRSYAPDGSDSTGYPINGVLTIPRKDIRVGCFELSEYNGKTLTFLTFSDLKRRGLQNLYLFKGNSFGRDGGSLEGRCSQSLKENDEYLYIRNGLQTSSEAIAEEGDLVMSKEGGFVGIVVGVTRFENGTSEAKCFVFPDDFRLRNAIRIRLDKTPGSKYLTDFETIGAKLLPRLEQLERAW